MEAELASLRRRLQSTLRRLQKSEHAVQIRDQTVRCVAFRLSIGAAKRDDVVACRTLHEDLAGREAGMLEKTRQLQTAQLALSKARNNAMAERARHPELAGAGKGDGLAVSAEVGDPRHSRACFFVYISVYPTGLSQVEQCGDSRQTLPCLF